MIQRYKKSRGVLCAVAVAAFLTACGNDKPENYLASAKQNLEKNEKKAAIIQIKNALQANPNLPEARFLLGKTLLNLGESGAAEVELDKARALKYPDDLVVPELAKALLAQGKFKKITDDFAQTQLETAAAKVELQLALSAAFFEQGSPAAGQKALDAALAEDPENIDALIMSVRRQAAKNNMSGALASIDAVIKKSPSNADALKLKGDLVLNASNNQDVALALYENSVQVKPGYLPGYMGMLVLLMQQEKLDEAAKKLEAMKAIVPNSPQVKYFETQLAYQKKDYKAAREFSQQLLKVAPNYTRGLQLAGAIEFQLNSMLQAEIYLNKALTASPELSMSRRMLTMVYLRTGQVAKAIAILEPALSQEPVDVTLYSVAGEAYMQNGDVKKAVDYFAKASKVDPKNAMKKTSLALAHIAAGEGDFAFVELRDISASDKGISADMALIGEYLRKQDYDKALAAISVMERKTPESPVSQNLRGKILFAQGNVAAARKSFEASSKLNPNYFPAVASLAALDIAEKKPDEASRRFNEILAKDPKNMQALLALAEVRKEAGGSKEEVSKLIANAISANSSDPTPRVLLVNYYLANKDAKAALSTAQDATTALPESPELLDAFGRALQASGDTNQAIATFNKLATLQPLSPLPQMRLANVNLAAKNKDAAVQNLQKALELKPDLLDAQRALAFLDTTSERYQNAITTARTIQRQRPKENIGYILEGDIFAEQKKWDEAISAYRLGLKQTNSLGAAIKIHAALVASGNKPDADKFILTWLKEHPKDTTFMLYMADDALAKKDYLVAEKYYANVVQLQPSNALAYNNLAWVSGQLKKDSAIGFAEKALSLTPNQPSFMDTLAMLWADKGDYAKAIEMENKALLLQPSNAVLKLNLAKIYIKSGDKQKAKSLLEDLNKLGKDFASHDEVESALKTL
jgi:putative PEP-CTERM system TPR-repeat lipoprotein